MTDRLTEALARASEQWDVNYEDSQTIIAAARKWEALTNHDEAMVDRAADALIRRQFLQSKPHILDQIVSTYTDKTAYREDAHAVFDALTDTAEPQEET